MNPRSGAVGPACPVCGTPVTAPPGAPCPTCGLPAAGQAGLVVGRISATLDELARDREALLATLRAAAPGGSPAGWAPPGSPPPWAPPLPRRGEEPLPRQVPPAPATPSSSSSSLPSAPSSSPVSAPAGAPWAPPPPPAAGTPWAPPPAPAPALPRRKLTPPQVLLALGALSLVAGALAFVALGWTRFGLVFQATVMVTVTVVACAVSAWAARRGLRATEEALAAAGTALLAVDLGAARARGLSGLEEVSLRTWTAVSCLVVVAVALALGRLTRSTVTWPVVALLAAQPVALLLLPADAVAGPAGVAVALATAAADLAVVLLLRPGLARLARLLAALWAGVGALAGLTVAEGGSVAESWTATALLAGAAVAAVVLLRRPRLAGRPVPRATVAGAAAAVVGLALAGSLATSETTGPVVAGVLGLLLVTGAALLAGARPLSGPLPAAAVPELRAALLTGGAALAVVGALLLADAERSEALALLLLAATLPSALAALRVPALRDVGTGAALLLPAAAVLVAHDGGRLTAPTAGLLLALIAAAAFATAAWRAGAPEEWVGAASGALVGLAAGATTATVGAWGQVALQLGIVGVSAGCYALVARRPLVAVLAVADLVLACWTAVGGAGIETPEAYTLPAAVGLLVLAAPRLRSRGPSWAAEGAAAGVALVPSALVVVADPSALRLVLVVAAAVALVVLGTVAHRQAPFVLGAGTLAFVVLARLGPYAPLLPRWVTLATAGLVLLVLGATYERRRQQAREAVAWVSQMS